MEMEAEGGRGDDIQPVSSMGEAGGQGQGSRTAGGCRVKELMEAGLVDDLTEAFLPERNVNVVEAPLTRAGGFCGEAGNSRGNVWRGSRWAAEDLMHQRPRLSNGGEEGGWRVADSTAEVEATATARERGLQPRPVGNWAANDGLQGAVDGAVKFGCSVPDVTWRASPKDEGDLGEGETGAQKGAFNLGITHAMKHPK